MTHHESNQVDVFVEVAFPAPDVGKNASGLFLLREHNGRQQTVDSHDLPFFHSECGSLEK